MADNIRQKFTSYERDIEIDLDFAQNRYYNPKHGRFTSADEPFADQFEDNPQSWNLYLYVRNNPLNMTDPLGMAAGCPEHFPDCIEKDGKYYVTVNGEQTEIDENTIHIVTNVPRDGGGPNLTVGEAMQQQRERREEFVWNNIFAGIGEGIRRAFGGIGRLFTRRSSPPVATTPSTPPLTPPLPKSGPAKILQIAKRQLQKKFKHAKDFGVQGSYNSNAAQQFEGAIQNHISSAGTQVINGTYRGQAVTHHFNPQTGLNVITDRAGNFISGWKLSSAQAQNVSTRGSL